MLLIYLSKNSARCDYVFDLIFKYELGILYRVTTDISEFERHSEEKISYADWWNGDAFFIKASPLLFETGIGEHEIEIVEKHETNVFLLMKRMI